MSCASEKTRAFTLSFQDISKVSSNSCLISSYSPWFDNFSDAGVKSGARYKPSDFEIKLNHLYQIHLSHGTAIFRNEVFKQNNLRFDPSFAHAEDYDLFDRAGTVCKLANIPKVVYKVRQHDSSVSKVFATVQEDNSQRVKQRIFNRIGINPSANDLARYQALMHQDYLGLKPNAKELLELLNELYAANNLSSEFDKSHFQNHLKTAWFHFCNASAGRDFNGNVWYENAKFASSKDLKPSTKAKLLLKRILR